MAESAWQSVTVKQVSGLLKVFDLAISSPEFVAGL